MSTYAGRVNMLPALLLAAAGVGVGHAVMPDHWLPLAVVSRTSRYRTARIVRLSLAAALTHVVVSLVFGAILVVIGLQFRTTLARHTDLVVGGILLATGVAFAVLDRLGKGHDHGHDDHEGEGYGGHGYGHVHDDHDHNGDRHGHGNHSDGHDHDHDHDGHMHEHGHSTTAVLERPRAAAGDRPVRGLAGLLIPFGAAASPDLTILPVFLAASALGTAAALGSLVTFAVATVVTIVGLTTAAALGARLFTASWIDRRANLITALTLIAIGALVAAGLI
jgi:nickel/cobalt transporter (NicO) family protein